MSEGTPPPSSDGQAEGSAPPPPPSSPPPSEPAAGGYAAAPPPPPQGAAGRRPGELLDRFLARLIDHVLLGVVNAIIISAIIVGAIGLNGASAYGYGGGFAASLVSAVIGVALGLGYFGFMESTQGRTLGKMAVKLHVEGPSGGNPTFAESVKRNWWLALGLLGIIPFVGIIGSLASLVVVIFIAVQINNDPERRPALTDRLADTKVVKEG